MNYSTVKHFKTKYTPVTPALMRLRWRITRSRLISTTQEFKASLDYKKFFFKLEAIGLAQIFNSKKI